jgi:DNA-binding NarL/FixJ family response regulator
VLKIWDANNFRRMLAGAHGYVLKGADEDKTLRAIRAVASGEAIFSPTIARRLMQYFATPLQGPRATSPPAFPDLAERERDT